MQKTAIFPTAYFGNIEYYSMLLKHESIIIEAHEHYVKQTFRNRCVIATANGPLTLTVPVHYSNTLKTKTKDVTIDYSKNWQKQHFKAIESAYRKSPFYEFFIDDFMFVFEKKEKFLLDLNMKILKTTFNLLQQNNQTTLSEEYMSVYSLDDFRNRFSPENQDVFQTKPYHQLFLEKNGFMNNICILDILFNTGNESMLIIN